MPRFKIHHVTRYSYQGSVRDSANQIMLSPINDRFQEVVKHRLQITGDPPVEKFLDYYGNEVGLFMRSDPHNELTIDSKVEVITYARDIPADTMGKEEQWEMINGLRDELPFIDFFQVPRFDSENDVRTLVETYGHRQTPLETSKMLTAFVFEQFQYITGITSVETTLEEVWKLKAGVCQDFAHILLVMLRMQGIPARYVSGYICPNKNGMRGEGATHAWVEAYIPYYGWIGLDPTNSCVANDLHVRLAVGRDFRDCSPVKGSYKGTSNHELHVGVSVGYENGTQSEETSIAILAPQPARESTEEGNSYRRYMEMMQQQQQ